MGGDREAQIERLIARDVVSTREEAEKLIERSDQRGTCSFCGIGDGWLGEMGDESTQYLRGVVRSGEPGDWKYKADPRAWGERGNEQMTWCANCVSGLAFKFQRYDDANLHALLVSGKVRMALDALRWEFWEIDRGSGERQKLIDAGRWPDDPAVHMDKLRLQRDLEDMQNETFRRAGFDLTTRGWRP